MGDTLKASRVREVALKWPGITRVAGQTEPRDIAKSDTISEHTFGNALDIYGTRKAMASLAAHLNANKGQLAVRIVCYDGGPGPKYDRCTTSHTDHIHVDFSPGCGGHVSTTGNATTRTQNCEKYQATGQNVTEEQTGGFWENLNPLSGVGEAIERSAMTVALIIVGGGLVVAGVVLVLKDTALNTALKTATKGIRTATKGAT